MTRPPGLLMEWSAGHADHEQEGAHAPGGAGS